MAAEGGGPGAARARWSSSLNPTAGGERGPERRWTVSLRRATEGRGPGDAEADDAKQLRDDDDGIPSLL
jgi:hypothetical protein